MIRKKIKALHSSQGLYWRTNYAGRALLAVKNHLGDEPGYYCWQAKYQK